MTLEEILKAIKDLNVDDFLQLRVAIRRLCTTDELGKTTVLSAELRLLLAGAKAAAAEPRGDASSPSVISDLPKETIPDSAAEILRFLIEDSLPLPIARLFFAIMAMDIEIRRELARPLIAEILAASPQLKADNIKPWELTILAKDVMAKWLEKLSQHKALLTPEVYAHFSVLSDVLRQKLQLHPMVDKAILTVCTFENYLEEAYNKVHQIDVKVEAEKRALENATAALNKELTSICEKKAKLREKLANLQPKEKTPLDKSLSTLEADFELVSARIENVSEPFNNKIAALESKLILARTKFSKQVTDIFAKKLTQEESSAIFAKIESKKEPKSKNLVREVSQRSLGFLFGRRPSSREGSPSFGVLPPRVTLNSPSPKGELFGNSPRLLASQGSSPRNPSTGSNSSSPRSDEGSPRDLNAIIPAAAAASSPARRLTKQPSLLGPNRPPSTDPAAELGIPRLHSAPTASGFVAKSPTSPLRGEGLLGRRASGGGKPAEVSAERSPSTVRRPPG